MKVRATVHVKGLRPGDETDMDDDEATPLVAATLLQRVEDEDEDEVGTEEEKV